MFCLPSGESNRSSRLVLLDLRPAAEMAFLSVLLSMSTSSWAVFSEWRVSSILPSVSSSSSCSSIILRRRIICSTSCAVWVRAMANMSRQRLSIGGVPVLMPERSLAATRLSSKAPTSLPTSIPSLPPPFWWPSLFPFPFFWFFFSSFKAFL